MSAADNCIARDIAHLHGLIRQLQVLPLQGAALSAVIVGAALPPRGVYFFCEAGEQLPPAVIGQAGFPRVTRVGTHAINTGSKSTLRSRLRAHLGSKPGGGNHRGSIFRLHVGNALLRLDGQESTTWGVGAVAPQALRESETAQALEAALERRVSSLIGAMHVLWVDVPDAPSPSSERAIIERGTIALLANGLAPLAKPSIGWLGAHSGRHEIRASGLWNLRHVADTIDRSFLDVLERAVERTLRR
jgi:hypothetical protein